MKKVDKKMTYIKIDKEDTVVVAEEAKYGRSAILVLRENEVLFDMADGEYGVGVLSIEELEEKLKEHKMKCHK